MPATAFDPMIKVNLMPCDIYTFDLREVMVQTGVEITEGLCVGILAWRAESKFLRFADEVAKVPRYRVKQGAYEESEPLYQGALHLESAPQGTGGGGNWCNPPSRWGVE